MIRKHFHQSLPSIYHTVSGVYQISKYQKSICYSDDLCLLGFNVAFKVSGPFVETLCIFLCMQNINYAEIRNKKA